MRKYGLECPIRRANPYKRAAKAMATNNVATNNVATNNVATNLLNRRFETLGARMALLTDITYIPLTGGGFAYLSTVKDSCTKEILGWWVSPNLKVDFVLDTLADVLRDHRDELYQRQ